MYGAYLRKSRADLELESNTGINTLKRHKDIILQTAKTMNVTIDKWWEEVVSGETIEDRPEIQKMLLELESGMYEGIFVVDVDRLARGDTMDQGKITKVFQFSDTKIITPSKTYDPNNEFDNEYFEFGLFMSRREYKVINRRMSRGRLSSVNEGKFVGSVCPFGYSKEKLKGQKGFKLIINDDEAKIVKIIFQLSAEGMGASNIANHLNNIGSKPRKSEVWVSASIRSIIHNPTYYGMIKWGWRKTEKKMVNGKILKSRPKHNKYVLVQGLHDPIITKEKFDQANKNSIQREGKSVRTDKTMQNPLSSLVKCSVCGRTMQRRNYRSGHIDGLICPLPHCKNVGSHLYLVEEKVIQSLQTILKEYNVIIKNYANEPVFKEDVSTSYIDVINKEISKLKKQLEKAFDLLEQEVYDNNTFIERSNSLKSKIKQLEKELEKYNSQSKSKKIEKIKNAIPKIEEVLKQYSTTSNIQTKNKLLRSIVASIDYLKIKRGKGHEDEFSLKINIKL